MNEKPEAPGGSCRSVEIFLCRVNNSRSGNVVPVSRNSAGFCRRIHQRLTYQTELMSTTQPAPMSAMVASGKPDEPDGTVVGGDAWQTPATRPGQTREEQQPEKGGETKISTKNWNFVHDIPRIRYC